MIAANLAACQTQMGKSVVLTILESDLAPDKKCGDTGQMVIIDTTVLVRNIAMLSNC